MNEYRCVIPSLYPMGTEFSSMQGHYRHAPDYEAAQRVFQAEHPGEQVAVRLWAGKEPPLCGPAGADLVAPLSPEGVFIGRVEAILEAYRVEHITSVDAIDAVQSALVKLKNRGSA